MASLKYIYISFFLLCFNTNYSQKTENQERSKINIDSNWNYLENDTEKLSDAKNATNWITINLPHSWNTEDVTDNNPGYRRSASWYKKNLTLSNIDPNKLYKLYFEGSNITTKVYVNGKEAGGHIGGYIGFTIDITNFVVSGNNDIMVRVDNNYNPEIIPSQKSDFFIYGGITRDVWLLSMAKNHIENIKITTQNVSEKSANLSIVASLAPTSSLSKFTYSAQLFNP